MRQSTSYLKAVYKSYEGLLVDYPKSTWEHDVNMVDILRIDMNSLYKVLECWVLGGMWILGPSFCGVYINSPLGTIRNVKTQYIYVHLEVDYFYMVELHNGIKEPELT